MKPEESHLWIQTIVQNYSYQNCMVLAQKQKYRLMVQDRRPRDKPIHLWTPNLFNSKKARIYSVYSLRALLSYCLLVFPFIPRLFSFPLYTLSIYGQLYQLSSPKYSTHLEFCSLPRALPIGNILKHQLFLPSSNTHTCTHTHTPPWSFLHLLHLGEWNQLQSFC